MANSAIVRLAFLSPWVKGIGALAVVTGECDIDTLPGQVFQCILIIPAIDGLIQNDPMFIFGWIGRVQCFCHIL